MEEHKDLETFSKLLDEVNLYLKRFERIDKETKKFIENNDFCPECEKGELEVMHVISYGHPLPSGWVKQYYVRCSEDDWFGDIFCGKEESIYELLGKKNIIGIPIAVEKCLECGTNLNYFVRKDLNQPEWTEIVASLSILPEVYYGCSECGTKKTIRYPEYGRGQLL